MTEAKARKEIEVSTYKRNTIVHRIDSLLNKALALTIHSEPEGIAEFKVRFEKLAGHYEGFNRIQADIARLHLLLEEQSKLDSLQTLNQQVDDKYFQILSLRERLCPSVAESSLQSAQNSGSMHAKLPKITLPTFDGTLKEWPHFKDLFLSLVHNNTTLPGIEKYHYLLTCTHGEPNSLVRSLPLSEENYELVWRQMLERYDNKRLLATHYVEEILNLVSVTSESPKPLRNLLDVLSENSQALKAMHIPGGLGDFIILQTVLKKVDRHTRQLFERKVASTEFPSLNDFIEFLKDHCKCLDIGLPLSLKPSVHTAKPSDTSNFKSWRKQPQKTFLTNTETSKSKCLFCSDSHAIYSCSEFLKLNVSGRRDFIRSKQACFNCLSSSHMLNKCQSAHRCRTCSKRHHTTLHDDSFVPTNNRPSIPNSISTDLQSLDSKTQVDSKKPLTSLYTSSFSNTVTTLLGTALVHIQDNAARYHTIRVLIDPGSQGSFITEACVNKLNLQRTKSSQPIQGISQTPVHGARGSVSCFLKPRHSDGPSLQTKATILTKITSSLPSVPLDSTVMQFFKDFDLADPFFDTPGAIDFLIGANLFPHIFYGGRADSPPGFPAPYQSIFGWILIGDVSLPQLLEKADSAPILSNLSVIEPISLDKQIKSFWEIEEPPQCKHTSPEDERCESIFTSTHSRDSTGRYVVRLPFKEYSPDLGTSIDSAERNFLALERRLSRDADFKKAYTQFMSDYEELGHMTRLDSSTATVPLYVIPHHGVYKNSDSNAKLRVVFNASAPTSTGISLNDKLHVGAKLQNDVTDILFRFRLHNYVLTADICKMYRQILVDPDDRPYQTIFWRSDPSCPLSLFLLNTVTYGVSSSPYLAIRTLHQLVKDEGYNFPLASKAILSDMFVDDCLTGTNSINNLRELKSQLIDILKLGGFQLSKWSSNHPDILSDVDLQNADIFFKSKSDVCPSIKVLGLKWTPYSDSFSFDVPEMQILPTKRSILSNIARIFDPLGLINPVVFWAKCLMQKLWTLGLDWDQQLPSDLSTQSNQFFDELSTLSNLKISRNVIPQSTTDVQLHGFSDASELGYGCVIYLRAVCKDGSVVVNLIMAKSKVAPLKRLSIPKLELCGAHLLAKTLNFCHTAILHNFENIPIFAWTDSMVVLHWTHTSPHLLKTFVANRVAELQSSIEPSRWRHTPTSTNPADLASRGLLPHQIIHHHLWWNGPHWLQEDSSSWPTQPNLQVSSKDSLSEFRSDHLIGEVTIPDSTQSLTVLSVECSNFTPSSSLEMWPTTSCQSTVGQQDLFFIHYIERFSSFNRLQRCTAWLLRFIHNCKNKTTKITTSYLTTHDLNSATSTLVRITQDHYLQEERLRLQEDKPCSPHLQRLNPFLDNQGILRVGGRIRFSDLNYNAKHPMFIPKQSHLAGLLIDHYHQILLHAGPRLLQSLLVRQFWINSARHKIRHRLSKCIKCCKLKAKSPQPYMGDLPNVRLKPSRAFMRCGVDYGGPILTKSDKLRKPQTLKTYICLFICMATKAIHLELVSSLSSDAFLAALSRFFSRRGLPSDIFSDQGTTFVGAYREINELFNFVNQPDCQVTILNDLSAKGVKWHFNPPSAPHFGGIWEAGIKSTKFHLKHVIGDQKLTFEELYTLLSRIEAILNSRPLCQLPSEPEEVDSLTPAHFLIGEPLLALPEPDLTDLPLNRLTRWQLIQQQTRHFWKRWSCEFLHTLQQREKWTTTSPNIKIGDVVIVREPNLPVLSWLLGRVIATHPGADGIVRVVTLQTKNGILKRPVVKLCPLPVS